MLVISSRAFLWMQIWRLRERQARFPATCREHQRRLVGCSPRFRRVLTDLRNVIPGELPTDEVAEAVLRAALLQDVVDGEAAGQVRDAVDRVQQQRAPGGHVAVGGGGGGGKGERHGKV